MGTHSLERLSRRAVDIQAFWLWRESAPRWIGLTAVVALAAALRLANLAPLGYANHYYAAAVESMLQSWHNFFFVAAEPGGSVSVDKPPVGLWLQAISAHFFGVNGFGLLLPEIVAGLLSIMLVYHLVQRSFGTTWGLLAALVLAITPVTVAVDRNNTIDSTLIFTLLLAAWAFIIATERGKLRYLLLGAALTGVAFNIKMLEAYLPLPAFYALYFLGSPERLWRKLGNLTLASVLLLAISLSWAVAVDLTPADQRPYVGSSGDNSEISLILGYNGMERLMGMGGHGGLLSGLLGGNRDGGQFSGPARGGNSLFQRPSARGNGGFSFPSQGRGGGFPQLGAGGDGGFPHRVPNGVPPGGEQGIPGGFVWGFGGGFGGMDGTGRAGVLRLFSAPLSNQMSWLLPFGLLSALLLAFRTRPTWPLSARHRALVLWGGWLLTGMAFFSVAGFFHPYYLATLAAPAAVLVGIGAREGWRARGEHHWLGAGLLVVAVGATLRFQVATVMAFTKDTWWLPAAVGLLFVGAVLLLASTIRPLERNAAAGFACLLAAILITPGIWSGLTTLNPSANQSLPSAYGGRPQEPVNGGGLQVNQALLDYLQSRTRDVKYLMAVPSSMQGADYVLATGRPVLYLGGFMGQDHVVTGEELSRMVADGELRYIYWNRTTRGGGLGVQSDLSAWVAANCTPVQGFDTATRNSGAPDGTSGASLPNSVVPFMGGGEMQVSLYACGPASTP